MHPQVQFFSMIAESPNESASTEDFEFAALSQARNYRNALIHEFAPHLQGNVIEIGAGIGQITAHLRDLKMISKLVSVEPSASFASAFRQNYPAQTLVEGTIEDVKREEPWNAILSINVLEHIREDETELNLYHSYLLPQRGCLCLFVPARPEIYAPIDKDFGHHRRYTKQDLKAKLRKAGFNVLRLNYFNSLGYFAWWLNFCLFKRRGFDVASVRLFDRAIFPIIHAFETRACRPPFGQSLLAVAQAIN
jgi:SAM-dependent methyltransferase